MGKSPLFHLSLQPGESNFCIRTAAAAKSRQSCPTLCNPRDGSPPGSPVPGILQAKTLEWVAIPFSNAWKWKVKTKSLSPVRLLSTPWNAAYQAPPSMGFSRQEYWSGVPLPSPLPLLRTVQFMNSLTAYKLSFKFLSRHTTIFIIGTCHFFSIISQPSFPCAMF